MSALKVLIPLAVGIGAIAFLSSDASASEPETAPDRKIVERIRAALATGEPATMRALAKQLAKEGHKAQAEALRHAADDIEKAMSATPAITAGETPKRKHPQLPGVRKHTVRVLEVQKGDGPWQVAHRVGMANAARELRDRNIPRDAKGITRASDGKGGFAPGLDPGDLLLVPEAWADHPLMQKFSTNVSGDDDFGGDEPEDTSPPVRRLAGRVALEVFETPKGRESRELVETYQKAMRAKGYALRVTGLYDADTAASLAKVHHIAPPLTFSDGKPLYWPTNPTPAKKAMRALLERLAKTDPVRAEEWNQVARAVA